METFNLTVKKTPGWDPNVKIPIDQASTVAEAIASGHYKNEAAIMHAANATRRVRLNRVVRDDLAENPAATVEDERKSANAFTYGERAVSTGSGSTTKKVLEKKLADTAAILGTLKLSKEERAKLVAAGVLPE